MHMTKLQKMCLERQKRVDHGELIIASLRSMFSLREKERATAASAGPAASARVRGSPEAKEQPC